MGVKLIVFAVLLALIGAALVGKYLLLGLLMFVLAAAAVVGGVLLLKKSKAAYEALKRERENPAPQKPEADPDTLPEDAPFRADDVLRRFEAAEGDWLDGTRDETNVNWLLLCEGRSLTEAVERYAAEKRRLADQFPEKDLYHFDSHRYGSPAFRLSNRRSVYVGALTMLRVPAEREAEVRAEDWEQIVRRCEENLIRIIVEEENFRFRELTRGFRYGLEMQEYPGSADDAATYGNMLLRQLTPEEKS